MNFKLSHSFRDGIEKDLRRKEMKVCDAGAHYQKLKRGSDDQVGAIILNSMQLLPTFTTSHHIFVRTPCHTCLQIWLPPRAKSSAPPDIVCPPGTCPSLGNDMRPHLLTLQAATYGTQTLT